ncbi:hypothetical protein QBC38DRAFT_504031 [Podospora fimiseda]|uniref:Uncharacterized protein n=1 Tax=Podospora fimiseda TaxID=252190 RepID=A0AAN7BG58_9PEZI|nr:hypothetical protein QBC38DRAFT_504031 [Podospora fimiseda]
MTYNATSTAGRSTPNLEIESNFGHHTTANSIPRANKRFILTDQTSKYALALQNGNLIYVERAAMSTIIGACWLWDCVEKNGWLGFKNAVSGGHLGVQDGVVKAHNRLHEKGSWLYVRPELTGQGYLLLVVWSSKLFKIGMRGNYKEAKCGICPGPYGSLEEAYLKSIAWGFIEQ